MPSAPKLRDTETEKLHLNYFYGGSSVDTKMAIANSFYSSEALDVRTVPSQASVLPGTSVVGQNTTDLIQAMDQDLNGIRWGIGNLGHLYSIDASNNFSERAVMSENGSAGLLYNQVTDRIYIPGQTKVSLYGQVTTGNTGQPVFSDGLFDQGVPDDTAGTNNLYVDGLFQGDQRSTAAESYNVPTVISEATGQFCFFSPAIEPGYSIKVYIISKGTGDWTLTLHDSLNTALATVTVTNANLSNNGFNEFVFGKQVRALVGAANTGGAANYHFHLTSTVADGTAQVVTDGDLSTANFQWFAYRLVQTNNGWHPTALFSVNTGGAGTGFSLCIGNGRYLSTYNFGDDSGQPTNEQWVRHQLVLNSGFEVCGLSSNNQYLVIAAERRSSNANRNFQDGVLYFWDGYSSAPNFKIDIPMGAPYSLQTFNNVTYFIVAGSLFAWSGGQTVIKVRKLAYQNTNYLNAVDSTIVAPNMMTIRYNLLEIAYPSSTTNVNLNYGVYTWGAVELMYPNSLTYDYTLSNGFLNNTGSLNLQIGCVYNFVDTMYMPWQYTDAGGTHYGVDLLTNFSTPATSFNMRSLIYDGGVSYKTKNSLRMQVTFLPMPAGYTLQAFYSLNRGADVLSPTAVQGDEKLVFEIDNARFHELQWGFVGTSSGATSPLDFTGLTMEISPLEDESDLRAEPPNVNPMDY